MSTGALFIAFLIVLSVCIAVFAILGWMVWTQNRRGSLDIEARSGLPVRADATPPGNPRSPAARVNSRAPQSSSADAAPVPDGATPAEIAHQLAALIAPRPHQDLTAEQQRLLLNNAYLDLLLSRGDPIAEWIRPWTEIRAIGHRLSREGGIALMRAVEDELRRTDEQMIKGPITVHRLVEGDVTREEAALLSDSAAAGLVGTLWERIGENPERVAREIIELAMVSASRFSEVSDDRTPLLWNGDYLDDVAFSDEPVEEAIRARAGIRAIGHRLDCSGGDQLMRTVYDLLGPIDLQKQILVGVLWSGGSSSSGRTIGNWQH